MKHYDTIILNTSPLLLKEVRGFVFEPAGKFGWRFGLAWRYRTRKQVGWRWIEDLNGDPIFFWRPTRRWARYASRRYTAKINKERERQIKRIMQS